MRDDIMKHLDKIILTFLFLLLVYLGVFVFFHGGANEFLHEITGWAGQILAALLTMMVGQRLATRSKDTNGATPTQTSTSSEVTGGTPTTS